MSKFTPVSWLDVKSAIASGLIMAFIFVAGVVISSGDIFSLNWKSLLNIGIIAFLTSMVSFLKSLFTTEDGRLAGVKIK